LRISLKIVACALSPGRSSTTMKAGAISRAMLSASSSDPCATIETPVSVANSVPQTIDEGAGHVTVRMSVTDTGIGIPPELQANLFQWFSQAQGNGPRRAVGTGLGLAICRRLAELMEGRIGVESTPGRGSTFWVELPLEKPAQPRLATADLEPSYPGLYVLVADSSPVVRAMLFRHLARRGLRPEEVSTCNRAFRPRGHCRLALAVSILRARSPAESFPQKWRNNASADVCGPDRGPLTRVMDTEVNDNGRGIEPDALIRIFEPRTPRRPPTIGLLDDGCAAAARPAGDTSPPLAAALGHS
jgi:hypothetical protein